MAADNPNTKATIPSESYVAIEASGDDVGIWKKWRHRFLERIAHSIKVVLRSEVPGRTTVNAEMQEAVENLASSAQAVLKTPQLKNWEKIAAIQKELSDVRVNNAKAAEIEANARYRNLEADKLQAEIEREKVQESLRVIDAHLKQGRLHPVLKDGQLIFLYNFDPSNKD